MLYSLILVYFSIKRERLGVFGVPYFDLGNYPLIIILNTYNPRVTPPFFGGVFYMTAKSRQKSGQRPPKNWRKPNVEMSV